MHKIEISELFHYLKLKYNVEFLTHQQSIQRLPQILITVVFIIYIIIQFYYFYISYL